MQLFSADATMFQIKIKFFFCPQKVEKTTLKSCSEYCWFLANYLAYLFCIPPMESWQPKLPYLAFAQEFGRISVAPLL